MHKLACIKILQNFWLTQVKQLWVSHVTELWNVYKKRKESSINI